MMELRHCITMSFGRTGVDAHGPPAQIARADAERFGDSGIGPKP